MGVVARNGNVYVADTTSHAVYRIDTFSDTAQKVLIAGLQVNPNDAPDVRYNGDGIDARQALLNNPTGLALDEAGNLYIADTGNHAIRRVAADANGVIPEGAVITTVAGVPTQLGVGDPALLFGPRGIAFDGDGNLFIADTMNQQIRKRATDGTMSVVAGIAGLPGRNNGPVVCPPLPTACSTPPARFNKPVGVAVDSEGRIFVADEGNNRVRMISGNFVGGTTTANPLRRPTARGHGTVRRHTCSPPTTGIMSSGRRCPATGLQCAGPRRGRGHGRAGLIGGIAQFPDRNLGRLVQPVHRRSAEQANRKSPIARLNNARKLIAMRRERRTQMRFQKLGLSLLTFLSLAALPLPGQALVVRLCTPACEGAARGHERRSRRV